MNFTIGTIQIRKPHTKARTWEQKTHFNLIMTQEYREFNNTFMFSFPHDNSSNSSSTNNTYSFSRPEDYKPNFSVIVTYILLFMIAAIGNLTVFISLFRSRHRRSRISLMIRHLAIADLIVTFVMIPIEVSQHNVSFRKKFKVRNIFENLY